MTLNLLNCREPFPFSSAECTNDLGAGTGQLPNKGMTATSYLGPGYQPWLARLFNPDGAWCSARNDGSQYLQVQFAQIREIRQLRTQGSVAKNSWVTKYSIEYSENGEKWTNYSRLGKVEVTATSNYTRARNGQEEKLTETIFISTMSTSYTYIFLHFMVVL